MIMKHTPAMPKKQNIQFKF